MVPYSPSVSPVARLVPNQWRRPPLHHHRALLSCLSCPVWASPVLGAVQGPDRVFASVRGHVGRVRCRVIPGALAKVVHAVVVQLGSQITVADLRRKWTSQIHRLWDDRRQTEPFVAWRRMMAHIVWVLALTNSLPPCLLSSKAPSARAHVGEGPPPRVEAILHDFASLGCYLVTVAKLAAEHHDIKKPVPAGWRRTHCCFSHRRHFFHRGERQSTTPNRNL
ncbi:hypothetical protein F5Y07DRAFT_233919 [Xylaria sp. FL0933]|nr:hypothetical protein F5Y07DRAFT_233919 [Xylaria sp. FL0933]